MSACDLLDDAVCQRGVQIEDVMTKITVVDRRTWGELRFSAMR